MNVNWRRTNPHMKTLPLLIFSAVAMLFLAGCAHTVRLKVVDVTTGQPLDGVKTIWRQDAYDLLLGERHRGPATIPVSRPDGVITLRGVHEVWITSFTFTRQGFVTLYGVYAGHVLDVAEHENLTSYAWHPVDLTDPVTRALATNGFILVPMRPHAEGKYP